MPISLIPSIVLFDLDGTILDNSNMVINAYSNALKELNIEIPSREYISSLGGLSTFETARLLNVPENKLKFIDKFVWDYFTNYANNDDEIPIVMDGVLQLLDILKENKIKTAIVTSNLSHIAKKLLSKVNLENKFDVIIGNDLVEHPKPDPEPIFIALEKLGYNILSSEYDKSIWFVGDSKSDIKAANQAKVVSIAIPKPFNFQRVINAEPEIIMDSMKDLYILFRDLSKKPRFCLASESRERRKLFESANIRFEIRPSYINEDLKIEDPQKLTSELSQLKVKAIQNFTKAPLLIGVDSVVIKNGKVYGKPKNRSDSIDMIKDLNGGSHKLLTSIFIYDRIKDMKKSCTVSTDVNFVNLSSKEIENYVDTFDISMYAGGYEIEGFSSWVIEKIVGSSSNVRGLPMAEFRKMILDLGYNWFDFIEK